jgi:hypothetical protein
MLPATAETFMSSEGFFCSLLLSVRALCYQPACLISIINTIIIKSARAKVSASALATDDRQATISPDIKSQSLHVLQLRNYTPHKTYFLTDPGTAFKHRMKVFKG